MLATGSSPSVGSRAPVRSPSCTAASLVVVGLLAGHGAGARQPVDHLADAVTAGREDPFEGFIAAARIDAFIVGDHAGGVRPLPAGREAAALGGGRLLVARRRHRSGGVERPADLADLARIVVVLIGAELERLIIVQLVGFIEQLADEVVELLLHERLDGVRVRPSES